MPIHTSKENATVVRVANTDVKARKTVTASAHNRSLRSSRDSGRNTDENLAKEEKSVWMSQRRRAFKWTRRTHMTTVRVTET